MPQKTVASMSIVAGHKPFKYPGPWVAKKPFIPEDPSHVSMVHVANGIEVFVSRDEYGIAFDSDIAERMVLAAPTMATALRRVLSGETIPPEDIAAWREMLAGFEAP